MAMVMVPYFAATPRMDRHTTLLAQSCSMAAMQQISRYIPAPARISRGRGSRHLLGLPRPSCGGSVGHPAPPAPAVSHVPTPLAMTSARGMQQHPVAPPPRAKVVPVPVAQHMITSDLILHFATAGPSKHLLKPPTLAGQARLTPRKSCPAGQASPRALSAPGVAAAAQEATGRCPSARRPRAAAPMPVSFHAGAAGVAVFRVLCYGDSLTVGFFDQGRQYEPYGEQLADSLSSALGGAAVEVIVCGQSGHTVAEMVSNLDSQAIEDVGSRVSKGLRRVLSEQSRRIDLVAIMAGTNDLGHDFKIPGILEDLVRLHGACHTLGVPTVALAPPPARRAGAGTSFEKARLQLVRMTAAWAQNSAGVAAFVSPGDLVPASQGSLWDPDGLHLAPSGSRQLGQRLSQVVAPVLLRLQKQGGVMPLSAQVQETPLLRPV
mmetsp:Transcript_175272/g.562149  ORF Transcript_175272/g.562149 Transcript_175272/m.562149 type:complete len:434 (-) Transcript_175272:427-1728(-)